MENRGVRFLGEGSQSHFLSDQSAESGGFIGSSILIAHRPGISDSILYNYYLHRAINKYQGIVIYPLLEPLRLPVEFSTIELEPNSLDTRKLKQERIYRIRTRNHEQEKEFLDDFYVKLISSKNRKKPFVIVIDTLKKWHPILEEQIRFLIHESSLEFGSVIIHCPLSTVPSDLLSVFGNVMVVWPSKHEVDLLNTHFPSETIPPIPDEENSQNKSWLLVFDSKPLDERGWKWEKFSTDK